MLKPDPPNLTDKLVASAALGAGVAYIWWAIPNWPGATIASSALIYEAWTLANNRPNDTISETIWRVSDRYTLIPLLGGVALAVIMAEELITSLWILAPLLILAGHFWFPRYGRK